jgi:hypothetical protein
VRLRSKHVLNLLISEEMAAINVEVMAASINDRPAIFSSHGALSLPLPLYKRTRPSSPLSPSLPTLSVSLPCPRRRRSRARLAAGTHRHASPFVVRSLETCPSPVWAPPNLAVPSQSVVDHVMPLCLATVCSSKVEDNPKFWFIFQSVWISLWICNYCVVIWECCDSEFMHMWIIDFWYICNELVDYY